MYIECFKALWKPRVLKKSDAWNQDQSKMMMQPCRLTGGDKESHDENIAADCTTVFCYSESRCVYIQWFSIDPHTPTFLYLIKNGQTHCDCDSAVDRTTDCSGMIHCESCELRAIFVFRSRTWQMRNGSNMEFDYYTDRVSMEPFWIVSFLDTPW